MSSAALKLLVFIEQILEFITRKDNSKVSDGALSCVSCVLNPEKALLDSCDGVK